MEETVVDLVNRVEQQTGKPVEIRIDKESQAPVTVKVARQRMAYHLLKLHPDQSSVASYLIANKCANILRLMEVDPSERVVPASDQQTMQTAREAIEKSPGFTAGQFPSSIIEFWIRGLINQLSNLPVQIRIERWVASEFPELQSKQRRFLVDREVHDSLAVASPEVERMTPRIIFEPSNAMNFAFVRTIGEIVGENYTRSYYNFPVILKKGRELYDSTTGVVDSYVGDVELISRWASILEISDWFVYRDFEDMPESYYSDIG